MHEKLEQVRPADIEKRSFEIITEELRQKGKVLPPGTEPIVKRCIHTSADFDYADNLIFSPGAVEKALEALRQGAPVVTDTQMGKAGINKRKLAQYGSQAYCFMSDEDVAGVAAEMGVNGIFAIGNAPTALVRLCELIEEEKLKPKLIIAVPVGFVNVVQAKEMILDLKDVPSIVAKGRKGGSNIAACICNALLYMMEE